MRIHHANTGNHGWQESFPNPEIDAARCRTTKSLRLCDPDGVLSSSELSRVDDYLAEKKFINTDLCRHDGGEIYQQEQEQRESLEIQMGVALVKRVSSALSLFYLTLVLLTRYSLVASLRWTCRRLARGVTEWSKQVKPLLDMCTMSGVLA